MKAKIGGAKSTDLIVPGFFFVVNDGGAEAPSGVDAGSGDGDGGQMDDEHREPDREWSQHLPEAL